jgi:UDP-N-acetylglucosamine--N-acetylmuramyl-(pentapeptide) pyrophosphoryl-undecaprenol N-acetylglucosamine transferase
MRLLFAGGGTGGHLYPGLAIARAVQRIRPEVKPFFIGAQRGIEPEVLPGSGFPFALLDLHPLYRRAVWNNWRTAVGMVSAWREIAKIVAAERPALVVGTGGYAAVATLLYATVNRIPFVEQTGDALPSLTARTFSRWAREIYLSFPESAAHFTVRAPEVLVDTGAPIEPPPATRPDRAAALRAWGFPGDAQVVLVYGGSQGSAAINSVVRDWIAGGLSPRVHVIWGTGRRSHAEFASLESDRVRVRAYLSPIAEAYAVADVAVARSGTMTVAELLAWGIPSVLVPLPTAAADHQTVNAAALAAAGAAFHLPQSALSRTTLSGTVDGMLSNPTRLSSFKAAAVTRARPNAAAEIARRIVALFPR